MRCTLWCQNVSSQTCRVFVFRCCLVYTLKVVFERNAKKKKYLYANKSICVCVSSNGKRPPVQKKRRGRRRENASMLKLNTDIYEWFRTTDESFYKRFIISNSACATLLRNISNVGGTGFSLRNRFFFLPQRTTMYADLSFISSYAMWKMRRRPDADAHRRSSSVRSYV